MVRAKHRTRFAFRERRASRKTGLPDRPVNRSRRDRKMRQKNSRGPCVSNVSRYVLLPASPIFYADLSRAKIGSAKN